jgi:hypothetical protein
MKSGILQFDRPKRALRRDTIQLNNLEVSPNVQKEHSLSASKVTKRSGLNESQSMKLESNSNRRPSDNSRKNSYTRS